MKLYTNLLEKLLLALIIGFFFTPLALTAFFQSWKVPLPHTQWLRNETLQRVAPPPVPLSWPKIWSGDYQKFLAESFNTGFAGRELLIRSTCEAWFRLFKATPLKNHHVFGQDDFIYNEGYLVSYYLARTTREQLMPLVRDMRKLQDACATRGIAFVLFVTPGKASLVNDHVPPGWQQRYNPRPRAYELFAPLAREYGLHFVDGHVLTEAAKAGSPTSIFAKGGIHWNPYASWVTANAILDEIRVQGKSIKPIEYTSLQAANEPKGTESDVLEIMNLAVPWRYPVTELTIKPRPKEECSGLNFTVVGGSFVSNLCVQLTASERLSQVDHYFYYTKFGRDRFRQGGKISHVQVTRPVDFKGEIFSSDCLLLEANEDALEQSGPGHLQEFVSDALKYLPGG